MSSSENGRDSGRNLLLPSGSHAKLFHRRGCICHDGSLDSDAPQSVALHFEWSETVIADRYGFIAARCTSAMADDPRGHTFPRQPFEGPTGFRLQFAHGEAPADHDPVVLP